MDDLLTTGDTARILDLTPRYVQDLECKGKLPAMRTARGMRLFKRSDVERLAAERAAQGKRESGAEPLVATREQVPA